jgi:hypothetical protein
MRRTRMLIVACGCEEGGRNFGVKEEEEEEEEGIKDVGGEADEELVLGSQGGRFFVSP